VICFVVLAINTTRVTGNRHCDTCCPFRQCVSRARHPDSTQQR
jgi:hypothetical protein